MQPIQLGEIKISRVVESEGLTPAGFLLPGATEEILQANAEWMSPHFYDPAKGMLMMSIHSFILRTRHHTILVDTMCQDTLDERATRIRLPARDQIE